MIPTVWHSEKREKEKRTMGTVKMLVVIKRKLQDIPKGKREKIKRECKQVLDWKMAETLELSDQECNANMINMLSFLKDKVEITEEQCK